MRTFVYTLMIAGVCVSLATGQDDRPRHDPRPFERVERLRKVRLVEALDLKEDQAVRFLARMNEFEKKRHETMMARQDALDRLEKLIQDGASDKELEKAFVPLSGLEEQMVSERRQFFAGLSDILSTQQRARFLTFERRFDRELREAVRDAQRKRMRGDEP